MKKPKFSLGDLVKLHTHPSVIIKVDEMGHEINIEGEYVFKYRDSTVPTPWFEEEMLSKVLFNREAKEVIEAKMHNEAMFNQQQYLSRLSPDNDADEAVKFFGAHRLLDEIGVIDAVDHFGEEEILKHIAPSRVKRYFGID